MENDRLYMGWLESDENLNLWRKIQCPKADCNNIIKLTQTKLQNNNKVHCQQCKCSFLYQFGQLFPEDSNARFPEPLPLNTPLNEEIVTFFNLFVDVLGSVKAGKTHLKEIFRGIRFVIGLFDFEIDAHATKSCGQPVVYLSRPLISGLHEFFLSILSSEDFIFSDLGELDIIDRSTPIQITPNLSPKKMRLLSGSRVVA